MWQSINHNKGKTTLIMSALFIVLVGALCRYAAAASRLPESINMSSTMHVHDTDSLETSQPTHIESLRLGETDAPLKTYTLTAEVVTREGLPDQWGYNGSVPGPELRVAQGDHVRVTLVNALPVSTSIHWHGIRVPNVADGVAGVTQDAVPPGESYTYDFIASDSGTYWYHSHQDTSNQIPHGLIGSLVVEPDDLPHYDHDYTLMYHDHIVPSRELPSIIERIAGGIDADAVSINGNNSTTQLDANPGELVRLRLINGTAGEQGAFGDPLGVALFGAPYRVVALDGHDLNQPEEIAGHILPVGSGQRYDLVFRMPTTGTVQVALQNHTATAMLGQGASVVADFTQLPTFDLTTYGSPAPNAVADLSSFDVEEDIILGNRAGFHDGEFGLNHTINSQEFPDVPMITVLPGQSVRLHMVNQSEEYHPMHLHGHTFSILSRNDVPLSGSPVFLDSLLLAPGEMWDVGFIADNPGLWMFHCHVLIHAATGMDMMLVYPNIYTPYVVGGSAGNIPE